MRPPTILDTDRLRLRPLVTADAPAVFAYASSESATRFMDFARHRQLSESEDFARRCEQSWIDGMAFPWALELRATRDFVGCIELRVAPPDAEFGYILDEHAWGQGLATEAATAVVSWAIAQREILRVSATCYAGNHASARVLEKAGLLLESRLTGAQPRPNLADASGDSLRFAWVRAAAG